jgi:hypothetical protein
VIAEIFRVNNFSSFNNDSEYPSTTTTTATSSSLTPSSLISPSSSSSFLQSASPSASSSPPLSVILQESSVYYGSGMNGEHPIFILMKHQYANYVIQKLFDFASVETKKLILESVQPYFQSIRSKISGVGKNIKVRIERMYSSLKQHPSAKQIPSFQLSVSFVSANSGIGPVESGVRVRVCGGDIYIHDFLFFIVFFFFSFFLHFF